MNKSKYTRFLEFLIENNISINQQQLQSLKEKYNFEYTDNKRSDDISSIINSWSYEDKKIYNINKTEKNRDYNFDDSKTIKEIIMYDNDIPIAFFTIDKQSDNSVDISLGVRSDYRGKGIGKIIAKKGTDWIDKHLKDFKHAYWATRPKNIASQKLAEENGWKLVRDDDSWKTYIR